MSRSGSRSSRRRDRANRSSARAWRRSIEAFISSSRRVRWLEALASAKRRRRFLDRLNHCHDFDDRYASLLPSSTDIVALLQLRGAPAFCHVISDFEEIDGRQMPLAEAVERAEWSQWGTLIICLPGRLAYYYDESGARRMLLERSIA